MNELRMTIGEIKLKVVRLLKEVEKLKTTHTSLEKENASLKNTIEFQKNAIAELEERNKMLKLAESLSVSKADVKGLKKKINGYIVEIDECIKLLSDR